MTEEKIPKNLSLEGCVEYRWMEIGVKDILGNFIKAGTGLFSIALEKKTCISSAMVPEILTLQSTSAWTHPPALQTKHTVAYW